MYSKKINTYIISGGKSSRMRSDKATLMFKDKTFLSHITEALQPLNTTIKLVSSLKQHQDLGYNTITDIETDKGPVCGITSALSNSNTDFNIILSCDIPFIKTDLLDWLLKSHSTNYDATIVCCEGKNMPLIGIYNTLCKKVFNTHLKNGQLKLMHVLNDLKINSIEVPNQWKKQVSNINTMEQLNALQ